MDITKNVVKNFLFEFIVREYHNKVKYGQPPTPLVHFYNNWLISALMKYNYIKGGENPARTKNNYQDMFIDLTWQAVQDLVMGRIIKRRLLSGEDLLHWDLYVPTEKGLEIWKKYGKLLIIPSNLVDSLRNELPEMNEDTELILDYLNEAVSCYFHHLLTGCCMCLSAGGEKAILSFSETFSKLIRDRHWVRRFNSRKSVFEKVDMIKEKMNNLITHGSLLKDYIMVYPNPDENFRDDLQSYIRSMELMTTTITLTRKEDGTPSLAINRIDETFREDLVLGYLVGSYTFFRLNFVIKEIFDNIIEFMERE